MNGAQLLVKCLEENNVQRIYAIPGAKVDAIFDALVDSSIKLIICRHEQNAAFMAGAEGRLTGQPGVVLVTSGPGVGNLVTGLLTATTEGDPIVAIGGNAARAFLHKQSHQTANNLQMMSSITKYNQEVLLADDIPAAVSNAFRESLENPRGSVFISVPMDVGHELPVNYKNPIRRYDKESITHADANTINEVLALISEATLPALFLGQESSRPENYEIINKVIETLKIPTICTFQAAGSISESNIKYFIGRVGLLNNQPGDSLLDDSDLIITIGYNPVEYDPELWSDINKKIIHINYNKVDIHSVYQPDIEVLGNIQKNLNAIQQTLKGKGYSYNIETYMKEYQDFIRSHYNIEDIDGMIHPLKFIEILKIFIDKDTIIACDIGSHGVWIDRYLVVNHPHQLLISNGQQTLGVSLPWAIAAKIVNPTKTIFSISGDGGFLFSAVELETAVREKIQFIHIILNSHSYDMVKSQQLVKYQRESGVELGDYNIVDFANSFGAYGYKVGSSEELKNTLELSLKKRDKKPTIIMLDVNYKDNLDLFEKINKNVIN